MAFPQLLNFLTSQLLILKEATIPPNAGQGMNTKMVDLWSTERYNLL
jgi:hypothetical protein